MQLLEGLVTCIMDNGADRAEFGGLVAKYNSVHPGSRARNSLLVKIQEVYCKPDETVMDDAGAAFVQNDADIDFTGAQASAPAEKKDAGLANEDDLDFR